MLANFKNLRISSKSVGVNKIFIIWQLRKKLEMQLLCWHLLANGDELNLNLPKNDWEEKKKKMVNIFDNLI